MAAFRTEREGTDTCHPATCCIVLLVLWQTAVGPTCGVGACVQRLQQRQVSKVVDEGAALEEHAEALAIHAHRQDGAHKPHLGGGGAPISAGIQQTQATRRQSRLGDKHGMGMRFW